MNFVRRVSEFVRSVENHAEAGNLNRALTEVIKFVLGVIGRDGATARVFSSPELDRLTLAVGRHWPIPKPGAQDPSSVVFVVTALGAIGGHSRVLRDIAAQHQSSKITVLVTSTMHAVIANDVSRALSGIDADVEVAPAGNHASRLFWLQNRLANLRPFRTFMLIHHYDAVSVAGAQPELVGELYFCHNGDHNLTLGVHVPHARHVDFHPKGFHHCRDSLGIAGNVMWPLTADAPMPPADRLFLSEGRLTTACCGGFEKFELTHMAEAYPYSLGYEDVVARVLLTTAGRHVHIGKLSEDMLQRIDMKLHLLGLAGDSFRHIPFVSSLPGALQENGVDLYMGSMPRGGGRATVEAMGAGMPLLIHSNYRSIFLCDEHEVYPGAMIWRSLTDLAHHLKQTTAEGLAEHAAKSRAFFEQHHAPAVFAEFVEKTFAGRELPPPPRPFHLTDALQAFLDEAAFLEGRPKSVTTAEAGESDFGDFDGVAGPVYPRALRPLRSAEVKPDTSHHDTRFVIDEVRLDDRETLQVHGWALSKKPITRIVIAHNDRNIGEATSGLERRDVRAAYPEYEDDRGGFIFRWPVNGALEGPQIVSAILMSGDEQIGEYYRAFEGTIEGR